MTSRTPDLRLAALLAIGLLSASHAGATARGSYWELTERAWLEQSFVLARSLLQGLELDAEATSFNDRLQRSLEDLNLERLYRLMGNEPGERRIHLSGKLDGEVYRVHLTRGESPALDSRLGAFEAGLSLRPDVLEGIPGEGFELALAGSVQLGSLSWQRLHRMVAGTLSLLEEAATSLAPNADPTPEGGRKLGLEDELVLTSLRGDFPDTMDLLETLLIVDDVATPDSRGLHVTLGLRLRHSELEKRFPRLERFSRDLGDVLRYRIELMTRAGRPLMVLSGESRNNAVRLELIASRGGLLPLDSGSSEDWIELGAEGHRALALRSEVRFSYRGLRTQIGPWIVPLEWNVDPLASTVRAEVKNAPVMLLEGNAFYVIPTSVIDVFIPGSLEGLSRNFAQALGPGEAGPGWSVMTTHRGASTTPIGDWRAPLTVDLEQPAVSASAVARGKVLDNGLVQLGMSMTTRKLRLNGPARLESRRLLLAILDALEADYRRALVR